MMDTFLILAMVLCIIIIAYATIIPIFFIIKIFKTEKIKNIETKFELEKAKILEDKQNEIQMITDMYMEESNEIKDGYEDTLSHIHYTDLSYEEVVKIVDDIFNEIWTNKYFMNYTIRELSVIPEMDKEIADITRDVYNALGDNVKHNLLKYCPMEYFIQKMTRRATILCMDYIKQNKPPIK